MTPLTPAHLRFVSPRAMAKPVVRFSPNDHAAPVLAGEPMLNDDKRADLHDAFYAAKSTTELAGHLSTLDLPADFKQHLLQAKNTATEPNNLDRLMGVVQKLAAMDPETRDVAEKYPTVLKALAEANKSCWSSVNGAISTYEPSLFKAHTV